MKLARLRSDASTIASRSQPRAGPSSAPSSARIALGRRATMMKSHNASAPTAARQVTKAKGTMPWPYAIFDRIPREPKSEAPRTTMPAPSRLERWVGALTLRFGSTDQGSGSGRTLKVASGLARARLVPSAGQADAGERHADLAERLDRDEEARQEQDDRQELRHRERPCDPEAVEAVARRRHEPAERDQ